jgi:hypothetical protein
MTKWPLLCCFIALLLSGCGSSAIDEVNLNSSTATGGAVSALLSAADGGALQHPSGHEVEIAGGALSQDATLTLSLLDSAQFQPRNDVEFDPVGQSLRMDLAGAELDGQATFSIPYETGTPDHYELYLHLEDNLFLPLETSYNEVEDEFEGTLDLAGDDLALLQAANPVRAQVDSDSLVVSLFDIRVFASRPPHVDWPSYNLYELRQGVFVKVIEQGRVVSTPSDPGSKPLMLVHGLGSNIPRFQATAAYLSGQGGFTRVYGFEYDTLSGIATSAPRLGQAFQQLGQVEQWFHLAHSMGTVVSRANFESGQVPPYQRNTAVLAAGPHLGSPVINHLQGRLGLFQRFVRYLVVNQVMDFRNADGVPCEVDINGGGFRDLAEGSAALAALNAGAASKHPQETYHTLGGDSPGLLYYAANFLIGIYPDDGLVTLASANPGALIGVSSSNVVNANHSTIVDDTRLALPLILSLFQRDGSL